MRPKEGKHEFYTIQFRTVGKNKWLDLDSSIKPVDYEEWHYCSWGQSCDPHIGTGNNWRAKNQKAHRQWHDLSMATGYHGWYDMKYAIAALKRLREDDSNGVYDSFDGYNKRHQRVRHEFRIVKLTISMKMEAADIDMLCESL